MAHGLRKDIGMECTLLGSPKAIPIAVGYGHMQPGGVTALHASEKPILVILCAPLNDDEWYCHDGRSTFDKERLFFADLQC